ncbi:hypothetical protein [Brachyspira aalborgi]|uniref:Uncharacterized protein n=1 Tax=Brachyspira aalborgi TaxID=29522 RepID=A0A5C8EFK4_9SPIR|nr:hypothetical protein [Brachyspira aalborgi]TXJ35452.1 hypothetical protein EPJ78_11110 [Brachyspira aalborgi]
MKEKYYKAELMRYYRKVNYTVGGSYSKYYFDDNANITNIYINRSGDTVTNCIFWGMLPDDTQIACYYYNKNNGEFGVCYSLVYENGLIKNKLSILTENGGVYRDEDLELKTRAAVLKSEPYDYYKWQNLNPPQVNTEDAKKWKNKIINKTNEGHYFWADNQKASYIFDSSGNLTILYNSMNIQTNEKYTFWGATNDVELYGLYYNYSDLFRQYSTKALHFSAEKITDDSYSKINELMHPKAVGYKHDYKTLNTSTTINENDIYKNNVKGKIIENKEVENTYTFLDNGDISVKTSKGKYYTLNFWGATNYYGDLCGIYYIKIDLKDIFGNAAPNESTYFYYGYRFDEYEGYKGYLPELREFWQDRYYLKEIANWYEKYFDKSGKPKGTVDWASMIIQESRYISFGNTQENILLFEKQK